MSGKVIVSNEVAKAIEYRLSGGYTFENFMEVKTARFDFGVPVEALNDVPIETLASALINGYEVEKTPEEMVREYYVDQCDSREGSVCRYRVEAIVKTLDLLGIKIEGVNGK